MLIVRMKPPIPVLLVLVLQASYAWAQSTNFTPKVPPRRYDAQVRMHRAPPLATVSVRDAAAEHVYMPQMGDQLPRNDLTRSLGDALPQMAAQRPVGRDKEKGKEKDRTPDNSVRAVLGAEEEKESYASEWDGLAGDVMKHRAETREKESRERRVGTDGPAEAEEDDDAENWRLRRNTHEMAAPGEAILQVADDRRAWRGHENSPTLGSPSLLSTDEDHSSSDFGFAPEGSIPFVSDSDGGLGALAAGSDALAGAAVVPDVADRLLAVPAPSIERGGPATYPLQAPASTRLYGADMPVLGSTPNLSPSTFAPAAAGGSLFSREAEASSMLPRPAATTGSDRDANEEFKKRSALPW